MVQIHSLLHIEYDRFTYCKKSIESEETYLVNIKVDYIVKAKTDKLQSTLSWIQQHLEWYSTRNNKSFPPSLFTMSSLSVW